MSEKIHKPNYEVENLKAEIQNLADRSKVGILPTKDNYFDAFLKVHNKEISSLQSEVERLTQAVQCNSKINEDLMRRNFELEKEIERLKSSVSNEAREYFKDAKPLEGKALDILDETFRESLKSETKREVKEKKEDTLNKE